MKGFTVVSAFRDLKTGELVKPGQDLPGHLDRDAVARLVRKRCVRRTAKTGRKAPPRKPAANAPEKAEDKKEEASGQSTFPLAGSQAVAGRDGDGDRHGAESDAGTGGGGTGAGEGPDADHRSQ